MVEQETGCREIDGTDYALAALFSFPCGDEGINGQNEPSRIERCFDVDRGGFCG